MKTKSFNIPNISKSDDEIAPMINTEPLSSTKKKKRSRKFDFDALFPPASFDDLCMAPSNSKSNPFNLLLR